MTANIRIAAILKRVFFISNSLLMTLQKYKKIKKFRTNLSIISSIQ